MVGKKQITRMSCDLWCQMFSNSDLRREFNYQIALEAARKTPGALVDDTGIISFSNKGIFDRFRVELLKLGVLPPNFMHEINLIHILRSYLN